MINKVLKALSCLVALGATQVAAATYEIDGYIIDDVYGEAANGFQSRLFHSQTCGQMCGYWIDAPTSASGTWNSDTGAIEFSLGLADGGSVVVTGNLLVSGSRSTSTAGFEGVYTQAPLSFAFSADSAYGSVVESFSFADIWFNPEANGYSDGLISLWGDNGRYDYYAQNSTYHDGYYLSAGQSCQEFGDCYGLDLRLTISPVPLPASFGLLVFGVGGMFGARRFKKKRS